MWGCCSWRRGFVNACKVYCQRLAGMQLSAVRDVGVVDWIDSGVASLSADRRFSRRLQQADGRDFAGQRH